MRTALGALLLFIAQAASAACQPADARTVAAAERKAGDLRYKADQAEATAVKSGNPGASARAKQAQAQAALAEQELAKLKCEEPSKVPFPKSP